MFAYWSNLQQHKQGGLGYESVSGSHGQLVDEGSDEDEKVSHPFFFSLM